MCPCCGKKCEEEFCAPGSNFLADENKPFSVYENDKNLLNNVKKLFFAASEKWILYLNFNKVFMFKISLAAFLYHYHNS